jgi:hypothetical protein
MGDQRIVGREDVGSASGSCFPGFVVVWA